MDTFSLFGSILSTSRTALAHTHTRESSASDMICVILRSSTSLTEWYFRMSPLSNRTRPDAVATHVPWLRSWIMWFTVFDGNPVFCS